MSDCREDDWLSTGQLVFNRIYQKLQRKRGAQYMGMNQQIWSVKNATMSDVSAQKEYGLMRGDIFRAMEAGKLQCTEQNMHGNPWFRLLRHEVELIVAELYGGEYLQQKKAQTELGQINKELKKIKLQATSLEKRKAELLGIIDKPE